MENQLIKPYTFYLTTNDQIIYELNGDDGEMFQYVASIECDEYDAVLIQKVMQHAIDAKVGLDKNKNKSSN